MEKLLQIMALLRDRQHGCPWDLEQTLTSLTRYTLEEVYEVVDAVEDGSAEALRDELGDLLFQVVFYARLAEEDGHFDFTDVVEAISAKLLRRHPHVFPSGTIESFGQPQNLDADQVVTNWEAIKKQERRLKGANEEEKHKVSVLADIPNALPALERSLKMQKRAAAVGFDWPEVAPVLAKLKEEIAELEAAMNAGEQQAIEHETGDILFAVVNLARHLRIEPEIALRQSNRRFVRRFTFIEEQLEKANIRPEEAGLDKLDQLWKVAKQAGL
jgi:ATP diphosphatase